MAPVSASRFSSVHRRGNNGSFGRLAKRFLHWPPPNRVAHPHPVAQANRLGCDQCIPDERASRMNSCGQLLYEFQPKAGGRLAKCCPLAKRRMICEPNSTRTGRSLSGACSQQALRSLGQGRDLIRNRRRCSKLNCAREAPPPPLPQRGEQQKNPPAHDDKTKPVHALTLTKPPAQSTPSLVYLSRTGTIAA